MVVAAGCGGAVVLPVDAVDVVSSPTPMPATGQLPGAAAVVDVVDVVLVDAGLVDEADAVWAAEAATCCW